MDQLPWIILWVLLLGAGFAMIYGAYGKWSWLVDPPEYLWPVYSQAFLKKIFGRRFVIGPLYRKVYQHLLDDPASPWNRCAWNLDLTGKGG